MIILLLAFLAEGFVFNWQSIATMNLQEVLVPLDYCSYEGLVEQTDDGGMHLRCGENGAFVQFSLKGSGIKLKNLSLAVSCINGDETWWGYLRKPYAEIESTAVRANVIISHGGKNTVLRERILYGDTGRYGVINTPDLDDAEQITLQLSGVKGDELMLTGIKLNMFVPVHIVPLRIAAVFMLLAFLRLLSPKSFMWKDGLFTEEGRLKKKYLAASFAMLTLLAIFIPIMISKNSIYMQSENAFHPYTDLARALAKGHLYLDLEPSKELLSLNDPYDPIEREEVEAPFQLDYALYEGRYYIYFGIIPCILLYLPWYVISGTDMPGWLAMTIMMLLCYSGVGVLIKDLIRRYRKDMPAGDALLILLGASSVLALPSAMGDANNYYAPMIAALDCFFWGMVFTLSAADHLEKEENTKGRVMLVLGSLFMAFIAGCRPQLILGAVCTLPVLRNVLMTKESGKFRIKIGNCIVFAAPYVMVASGLMLYNALRFGSPFDFGAMKNLTFAFLDNAGFNLTAAGAGIYYYLFRLPSLTAFYPYLGRSEYIWSNPNILASHPSIGGIFLLFPVLLLAFACFFRQNGERNKEVKWIGVFSVILIPVLAAITATMGGLMDRYRMDIAPFAALALICGGFCFISSEIRKPSDKILKVVLTVSVILAVVVSGLTYATEGLNYLQDVNPEAYMDIAKAIEFWR